VADGFLSSMNGSSVTFVGGDVHDVLKALEGGSLSMNECLLPLSFVGDGVTGNAFKSDCFVATGDDGISGVFSGSNELMVIKVVCCWLIRFRAKLNKK
jgi:hypothetical protein